MRFYTLRVFDAVARVYLRRCRGLGEDHGICRQKGPGEFVIHIRPGMSDKDTCETLIHESLHAASWSADEAWVAQTARGITDLLWELGFRREK